MDSAKEIKRRIGSVQDTLKITNAMYLVASAKYRKARREQQKVNDYFVGIRRTIENVLDHMRRSEHIYLEPLKERTERKIGYIVITSDKGLAGGYNIDIVRFFLNEIKKNPAEKIYIIGQVGRHVFSEKKIPYDPNFYFASDTPTLRRARNITVEVLDDYHEGVINEVRIIYTHMKNKLVSEPTMFKLLPLERAQYYNEDEDLATGEETFFPDTETVFDTITPIAMHGIIFSTMTESYCAELNDRMMAMSGASKNAEEMVHKLNMKYHRMRQQQITQEITEIAAGAKAQAKRKKG